ncbi:hypothetical protein SDC9_87291 [bioreactor metagenome]|uniref:Rad50/SbcC-type AAA domain-containing protein n=1 Tax=bioreactor metagenome TaxID=1076179 RepID=A0A644ZIU2_9ZZZZ
MKILIEQLQVQTKKTKEIVDFSESITYIYGPVGKGKSTVARLVDFCLGGHLENTPAIQQEFVSATLYVTLGLYKCTLERSATDTSSVRVTWYKSEENNGSIIAPLQAESEPIISETTLYNLSDVIYHLCGVEPIKVRQRSRDADSPLIRLSFRDLWRYCYLEQMHLDSSFFRFEDPFRGRKSQDAMRFFTGLHSERLSQLENDLMKSVDSQRAKREAVKQIREFMSKFSLGSESDIIDELTSTEAQLTEARNQKEQLHKKRNVDIHPTDPLRVELVELGDQVLQLKIAINDSEEIVEEQRRLHSELITAKIKNERISQASMLFDDVHFECCPACGSIIQDNPDKDICSLCGSPKSVHKEDKALDDEVVRKDINTRIDELADSIKRRDAEIRRAKLQLDEAIAHKEFFDAKLQEDLSNYDSAIVEEIRQAERTIATLEERVASLSKLRLMPQAINKLEEEAGAIQGKIDSLRSELEYERSRLVKADEIVHAIADEFKRIMISVKYPGVYDDDHVSIDPRNWRAEIVHGDYSWSFWDTGSGGKKTLFNVCYALAIHSIAVKRNLPVPSLLVIDSPTKNISDDENPELVASLYREIYQLSVESHDEFQLLLIDSDFVAPETEMPDLLIRHMAGTEDAPSLIPYYEGP